MATLDTGSGGVLPAAQYSNLENFFVRNVSGTNGLGADNAIGGAGGSADTVTFNFATVTGEEQVWNDRSTNSVLFTNLAAGTTVGVKGEGTVVATTGATYVATAAAANIALDGGLAATAAGATGGVQIQGAGLRSATVTSTNGTNNISFLTLAGGETSLTVDAQSNFAITDAVAGTAEGITGAGLTSITVKGAGSANLGSAAIPAAVATVDASANTGGVTLTLSAANTAVSNGIKFTGGSGNDVVTTNGLSGTLLTTASIDAGAGTADRLVVANTNDILIPATPLSKAQGDLYKGFEQVQVQNGVTVNVDLLGTNNTIDAVRINDGAGATGVTNVSATGAQNVTILAANSAAGAITIGVKGATTTGQIDTVKAAVTTTTAAGAAQNIDLTGIVLTGVENLELTGSNGADKSLVGNVTLTTTAATDLSSIKLNNGNVVDTNAANNNSITVAAGQAAINLNIDATGSGDTTVNAAAYNTATGVRITTDAGNDVIQGSARADVIVAGAGDDTITGDVATALNAGTQQVNTVTFTNSAGAIEAGDIYTLNFNSGATVVNYTVTAAVAAGTGFASPAAALQAALVNAINGSAAGVTAAAGAADNTLTVTQNQVGGVAPAGFTLNASASNAAAAVDHNAVTFDPAVTYDAGDTITVTINGTPYNHIVLAGATSGNALATAVAATINGAAHAGVTVAAAANVVNIDGTVAGIDNSVATSVTNAGDTAQVATLSLNAIAAGETVTVSYNGGSQSFVVGAGPAADATDFGAIVTGLNGAGGLLSGTGVTASFVDNATNNDGVGNLVFAGANPGSVISAPGSPTVFTAPTISVTGGDGATVLAVGGAGTVAAVDRAVQTAPTATDGAATVAGANTSQSLASVVTTPAVAGAAAGVTLAADTLTGGAGNDTFVILGGAGDNGSTFTTMDTITDLNLGGSNQAGRVDVIDLNPGVASTITALVNAGQPLAMNAQATSLSAAVNGLFTAGAALATAANGTAGLFTYNGDTYLIALNGGAVGSFDGNDTIIKVTGVAGTLDISDFI